MSGTRIRFVDSHTEGEPTRVVLDGGPVPAGTTVAEQARDIMARHAWLRGATVDEPRGHDVLVGALVLPSTQPGCAAGVIFWNSVGLLGMCGHGTIGVVRTLAHLGLVRPGEVRLETTVGTVTAVLHAGTEGRVSVRNVRSYRHRADVELRLEDGRTVHGDVAWGGNGFLLVHDHGERVERANVEALTRTAWMCRRALERTGFADVDGHPVDHVELVSAAFDPANDARSFVLCPGGAYDRSPCGTGTSAALACRVARGEFGPGRTWRQESVIGSVFEATCEHAPEGGIVPTITGRAWIVAEGDLVIDPADPFRHGVHGSTGGNP